MSTSIEYEANRRVTRILPASESRAWESVADEVNSLILDQSEVSDLLTIGYGGYTPLIGFLEESDYRSVVERGTLADGHPWPLVVALSVNHEQARNLRVGQFIALRDTHQRVIGRLQIRSIYQADQYQSHSTWFVGGPIDLVSDAVERSRIDLSYHVSLAELIQSTVV